MGILILKVLQNWYFIIEKKEAELWPEERNNEEEDIQSLNNENQNAYQDKSLKREEQEEPHAQSLANGGHNDIMNDNNNHDESEFFQNEYDTDALREKKKEENQDEMDEPDE